MNKEERRGTSVFIYHVLGFSFLTDRLFVDHPVAKDLGSRRHLPWLRQNIRVFHRGFPAKSVPDPGEALHDVQCFSVKIPASSLAGDSSQPCVVIKVDHIDY